MQVINPATEEIISEVTEDTESLVKEKYHALRIGQPGWAVLGVEARIAYIDPNGGGTSGPFFETMFALATTDDLDARGMPRPLQLAVMVPEFESEIRPLSPPWPVLRAVAAVLAPLARARGYRARVTA